MFAEIRMLHSLEKLLIGQNPSGTAPETEGFENEIINWQAAAILREGSRSCHVRASVAPEWAPYVKISEVRHVPVRMPVYDDADDRYLSKEPGLYPDLLTAAEDRRFRLYNSRWTCLWLSFDPKGKFAPGEYSIPLTITAEDGTVMGERVQTVRILPGRLPEQKLLHTKWFHADCLAQYYGVEAFSEEHWRIIENFVRCAADGGINMILTPIHTPPLDTREGGERLTVQLVGITAEDGVYHFDMSRLHRWIAMCRRCGIEQFEMAHLFTQWGAKHAPKIVAAVGGEEKRIFGWETDAAGPEYGAFLRAYIPALRKVFEEEGVAQNVWWHISDEPSGEQLPHYLAAKRQVEELLRGEKVMDALSDFEFYRQGVVDRPVVASSHLQPFLEVPDLWMYYCCGQYKDLSNTFIAMPSARCRVLGMQLFRYRIAGFLQWGFNFYNSQYSDDPIDPYADTDADGFVPAGDPFQVYPGPGGVPELSVRYMVFQEAMQDLRALELLASLAGRERADALLEDLTLTHYPDDAETFLALRKKINQQILLFQKG